MDEKPLEFDRAKFDALTTVPDRVAFLIRAMPSRLQHRSGKCATVEEFAERIGTSKQSVFAWKRAKNPQEPTEFADALAYLASSSRDLFLAPRDEVVTLEMIDRHLGQLERSIGRLSRILKDAVAQLDRLASEASQPSAPTHQAPAQGEKGP